MTVRRARARYRRDDVPEPVALNETLDVIFDHRSVRAFLSEPLADGLVETLITAAQSAASSSNLQVWSVGCGGIEPVAPAVPVIRPCNRQTRSRTPDVGHYDRNLRAFQREQNLPERDWSEQAGERTRGPESMAGRHELRDVLGKLGFPLF